MKKRLHINILILAILFISCATNNNIQYPVRVDDIIRITAYLFNKMLPDIPKGSKIAVLDIDYNDKFINTEIKGQIRQSINEIKHKNGFKLIESEEYSLDKLKEILKLDMSGYVDDDSAARIGHWLGVDEVILGRILTRGAQHLFSLWAVDVETRERISSVIQLF
jgi:hypothetical protein